MRFSCAVVLCATFCSSSVLLLGCSSDFGSSTPAENEAKSMQDLSGAAPSDAKQEVEQVRAFLDSRYTAKDVRHSFHTKFGETIDCIDFFAQQGVKELADQGTPITELPAPEPQPNIPPDLKDVFFTGTADDEGQARACPQDSVPILRITAEDIRAAGGLHAFIDAHHRKASPLRSTAEGAAPPSVDPSYYAHVQQSYTGSVPVLAAKATINIAKPSVIGGGAVNNHSIIQTWLMDNQSGTLQTVEAGINVDPVLYGNYNTHFFVFATNNNYGNGCYNNMSGKPSSCLAWVGAPGATLTPGMTLATSTFNGTQKELNIQVFYSGGWNIKGAGYYPRTDFVGPMSTGSANMFSVGAEVYDITKSWYVPMGSGAQTGAGYGQAAYWNAPGDNGSSVIDINGNSNTTSFGSPTSDRPSDYKGVSGQFGDGRVYVGPLLKDFFASNYGYQWSAIGDWAFGSYKAQCDYQAGIPLKGVAANKDGASSEAILCGDYVQGGTGSQCYARSFENGDNVPGGYPDWDPGYTKGECGYMEVASGIAQSASRKLNTILCCAQLYNADHNSCTVETFGSSNSASYGSGPDWAYSRYKGVCPVGKAVVGISRKSTGAAHAILCCHMD